MGGLDGCEDYGDCPTGYGIGETIGGLFTGHSYQHAMVLMGFILAVRWAYVGWKRSQDAYAAKTYGEIPKWLFLAAFCCLLIYGYFAGDPVKGWK